VTSDIALQLAENTTDGAPADPAPPQKISQTRSDSPMGQGIDEFQTDRILCKVPKVHFVTRKNAFRDALVRFSPNANWLPCNVRHSSDNLR